MLIHAQTLTAETFRPFGWMLGNGLPLSALAFSNADIDFWEEHLFEAGAEGETQILWVNYRSKEPLVSRLEVHRLTQQIVVPLTGEIVQIVAASRADGTLDLESVKAFRVKVGQGLCMRPGCWHTTRVDDAEVMCLMVTRKSTTEDLVGYLKGASPLKESALVDVDLEIAS
jgi:ureidoglycolate lyase